MIKKFKTNLVCSRIRFVPTHKLSLKQSGLMQVQMLMIVRQLLTLMDKMRKIVDNQESQLMPRLVVRSYLFRNQDSPINMICGTRKTQRCTTILSSVKVTDHLLTLEVRLRNRRIDHRIVYHNCRIILRHTTEVKSLWENRRLSHMFNEALIIF